MLMKVKLIKEEFNENLNIRESKEFQDLSERIVSQVKENESFQVRIHLSVCCIFQTTIVYFSSNSQRLRCAFDRSQSKKSSALLQQVVNDVIYPGKICGDAKGALQTKLVQYSLTPILFGKESYV